jgi:hypothetical protein
MTREWREGGRREEGERGERRGGLRGAAFERSVVVCATGS